MKKIINVLDTVLLIMILLSVIQLILDDLGIIYFSSSKIYQDMMIYSAFAFDFLFSLEFITRSVYALTRKNFKKYFFYQGGWIDLFASLPLLFFNSGPMLFLLVFQQTESGARSVANLLKIIKAIRVTRILRLLRLLKIFGRIENVFSAMVQHHISAVSSLVVVTSISVYAVIHLTGFIVFQDPVIEAKLSLLLTLLLISSVVAVSLFYSAHFAKNISDPIYVMQRGFKEADYNYSVKIKPAYLHEEIFGLAASYNKLWLPLKKKIIEANQKSKKAAEKNKEDYSDLL